MKLFSSGRMGLLSSAILQQAEAYNYILELQSIDLLTFLVFSCLLFTICDFLL